MNRGKAPAVFIAQPEGLGYEIIIAVRTKGPAVSPTPIVRQFRSHVFKMRIAVLCRKEDVQPNLCV